MRSRDERQLAKNRKEQLSTLNFLKRLHQEIHAFGII